MDITQRLLLELLSKFDSLSTKIDSHEESINLLKSKGGNGSSPHPLRTNVPRLSEDLGGGEVPMEPAHGETQEVISAPPKQHFRPSHF